MFCTSPDQPHCTQILRMKSWTNLVGQHWVPQSPPRIDTWDHFSEEKSLGIGCIEATESIQGQLDKHLSQWTTQCPHHSADKQLQLRMSLSLRVSPTLPKQTLMLDSGYHIESNRYNRSYKWVTTTAKRELKSCGTQPWLNLPQSNARPAPPDP